MRRIEALQTTRLVATVADDAPLQNPSRFKRFVYEFEVEVTDANAVELADLSRSSDESDLDLVPEFGGQVRQVVQNSLSIGLEAMKQHGLKFLGGSLMNRPVDEDGNYLKMPLPSMSGRDEDGELKLSMQELMDRERAQEE